jgi:hypothetical protein
VRAGLGGFAVPLGHEAEWDGGAARDRTVCRSPRSGPWSARFMDRRPSVPSHVYRLAAWHCFVRQDRAGSRRRPSESEAGETNSRDGQACIELVHVRMNQEPEVSFVSTPKLTP